MNNNSNRQIINIVKLPVMGKNFNNITKLLSKTCISVESIEYGSIVKLSLTFVEFNDEPIRNYFTSLMKDIIKIKEKYNTINIPDDLKISLLTATVTKDMTILDYTLYSDLVLQEISGTNIENSNITITFNGKIEQPSEPVFNHIKQQWQKNLDFEKTLFDFKRQHLKMEQFPITRNLTIKSMLNTDIMIYKRETEDNITLTISDKLFPFENDLGEYIMKLNLDAFLTLRLASNVIPEKVSDSITILDQIKNNLKNITISNLSNGFDKVEQNLDDTISILKMLESGINFRNQQT